VNIMTAEDPVEFNLPGINQVQMKESIGLNFAATLRSFLRQDPNIILVGEIRDFETAEIAIKAALTGHLVLSTLHTNDAPSTINRLMNMGIEPFLVATLGAAHRRAALARRICAPARKTSTSRRRRSSTSATRRKRSEPSRSTRARAATSATTPATKGASASSRS
jgi:type IV pilus assembly protein PilB